MQRVWQRALVPVAVGALALGLLTGCPGAIRRPGGAGGPGGVGAGPDAVRVADLNGDIARVAAAEPGAGRTAAVVLGNVALVAINLDNPDAVPGPGPAQEARPGSAPTGGGTSTQTIPGTGQTSAPGAEGHTATPGGAPGASAARPGGSHAPGPTVPGGLPQVTNGAEGAITAPGAGGPPQGPMTSSLGMVHNRIAQSIHAQYPFIAEVRFVADPQGARELADLAGQVSGGRSVVEFLPRLAAMAQAALSSTPLVPMPDGPPLSGFQPSGTRTTGPGGQSRQEPTATPPARTP